MEHMISQINSLDIAVFRAINRLVESPLLDSLMITLSSTMPWVVIGVAILLYAFLAKNWKVLGVCVSIGLAIGMSDAVAYYILKPTFKRERPCHQLEDVRIFNNRCGGDYGFPSNHAANGMAAAVTAALTLKSVPIAATFVGLAVLVGYSRVHLGVHFPGDILVGLIVGGTVGLLIFSLQSLFLKYFKDLLPRRK